MPPADEPSVVDGELLRRCGQGDEQALAELIRRYQDRLYRLALRVAGDETLAEEAAIESFYKLWRRARQWRNESVPQAWIYRIAVRTVLDLQRGRRRWRHRLRLAAGTAETTFDAADALAAAERQSRISAELERVIRELNEEDRALVHLYYYEDRGLKEIAEVLNASHDALKMRLSRVRKRLRQLLKDFDDE